MVIGIIGVLVSLAMVSYTSAQRKSRDSRRQADMKAIQGALEVYYSENSYVYPAVVGGSCASAVAYMKSSWPVDPVNSGTLVYTQDCDTSTVYCVCAKLEVAGKGNASSTACGWGGTKTHYCVGSLQ